MSILKLPINFVTVLLADIKKHITKTNEIINSLNAIISNLYKTKTIIDFGTSLFPEQLYVDIIDRGVTNTSSISMNISITRDIDELEFCNFTCSLISITEKVGYKILVQDHNRQAEGVYYLNTIRT